MWRFANCVYRVFRNTATHRCSQDVLIPLTTVCHTDDDSNLEDDEKSASVKKYDLQQVLKNNQFTHKNLEKLQEYLKKFSIQQSTKQSNAALPKAEPLTKEVPPVLPLNKTEESLDSLLKADENCTNTLKSLTDLQEETAAIINLELALEALESGDLQFGIEALQASARNNTNAAALYNLGICYERGIGVEQDRAKACDYYRQASALGHINAQFNLSLLSNHIDIEDDEDEALEESITKRHPSPPRELFFRFTFPDDYKEDQSFNDYSMDLRNPSIICTS